MNSNLLRRCCATLQVKDARYSIVVRRQTDCQAAVLVHHVGACRSIAKFVSFLHLLAVDLSKTVVCKFYLILV